MWIPGGKRRDDGSVRFTRLSGHHMIQSNVENIEIP